MSTMPASHASRPWERGETKVLSADAARDEPFES